METWREAYKGIIPKDNYNINVSNSDEDGLVVKLTGRKNEIIISFGIIEAIIMLDEGIVQDILYSDKEIKKYKKDKFENVIYEIEDGMFKKMVEKISSGIIDLFDVKHYVIITENFNVDIITEWEPEFEVNSI